MVQEPTRGLGEQQAVKLLVSLLQASQLDNLHQTSQHNGRENLKTKRDTPLRRPMKVECTVADPARDQGTNSQHELLQGSHSTTNGGMGNLALVHGDDHDQEPNTESCNASTGP